MKHQDSGTPSRQSLWMTTIIPSKLGMLTMRATWLKLFCSAFVLSNFLAFANESLMINCATVLKKRPLSVLPPLDRTF